MKNSGIKSNGKLKIAVACAGAVFAGLSLIAASKKKKSVFDDRPEQKNPFEGKRVVFVRDESDQENADGVCGHLEVVEDDKQQPVQQSSAQAELQQELQTELQSDAPATQRIKSKQQSQIEQPSNVYDVCVKRGLDIALSFGGLVLLAPVYAAIALAIKIEDPGPVLFTQKRVGRNKQYFELHKFRSMKVSTPHDVPTHMLENPDQYITKVGKFLRAHSLDELPQIWDIFMGNMSVVGPRPALWNQDVLTAERDKYGANDLRPGLTGWAQINGRDELELEEKAKLDGEYVKKESLLFDVKCFLETIKKVGHDDSVVEGSKGEASSSKKEKRDKTDFDKAGGMKILVVCQYYWPEQFQITDICEDLASRGHRVTVLTGLPNVNLEGSPNEIPAEYKNKTNWLQERNGVKIVRCHEISRRTGIVHRMLNYYSYWKSAVKQVASLDSDFDVVFAYQLSPGMMAEAAIEYKKRTGTPVVLYCCDLWPESLKAWLGDRFGCIVDYYGRICRKIYRGVDRLLVQSPAFNDYLVSYHGVDEKKIEYVPQFATDDLSSKDLNEAHDGFNVLFLGNMGSVQGIETMLESALLTKEHADIYWHFVGDGEKLEEAKGFVERNSLQNQVIFHGRKPMSEMENYYKIADVCVLALNDSSLVGATIPSKLQGYMAAGKPVIGAVSGGARMVIEQSGCGAVVSFGDSKAMADAIFDCANSPDDWCLRGLLGRDYFKSNFSREAFIGKLERILSDEATTSGKEEEYI